MGPTERVMVRKRGYRSATMAWSGSVVLVMVLAMAMVAASRRVVEEQQQAECGRQAYDALCLFNACCSKEGQCGRGEEHCGAGCQSGPCKQHQMKMEVEEVATPAECGEQAYSADCWPRSMCCSASGHCGTGNDFCGAGCQSGACTPSSLLNPV